MFSRKVISRKVRGTTRSAQHLLVWVNRCGLSVLAYFRGRHFRSFKIRACTTKPGYRIMHQRNSAVDDE